MGASGRGCIGGAKFVSAGVWACVGIFMVNVLNAVVNGAEWHDMMPLYVGVMVVAVAATIAKYWLQGKAADTATDDHGGLVRLPQCRFTLPGLNASQRRCNAIT